MLCPHLVALYFLLIFSTQTICEKENPSSKILVELFNKKFPSCDIVILAPAYKEDKPFHTDSLPWNSGSAFQINTLDESHTVKDIVTPIQRTKKRHRCQLKVFVVELREVTNVTEYLMRIAARLQDQQVSKSSEDYFIFLATGFEVASRLLKSKAIGQKIKLKIVLNQQSSSYKIDIYSACLFCEDGGLPQVMKISYEPAGSNNSQIGRHWFRDDSDKFNGAQIRISGPLIAPRLTLTQQPDGSYKLVRGLYKYLIEDALQVRYNFSYWITKSDQWAVGSLNSENKWNGIMKDVIEGYVDVGICVGMTSHRFLDVEFASMMEAEYLTFSSGKKPPAVSWKAFLWAFTADMWIATLITFMAAVGVMFIFLRCKGSSETVITGPGKVMHYLYGAFLDQSVNPPSSSHLRIFCTAWMLFSLVVSNAFREKLFGFLGFPLEAVLPQTFEELGNSNFEIGLQFYGGAAYDYINSSKNQAFQKIANRMSLETDAIRCFTKLSEKPFSCIHYFGAAEFVRARNFSDRYGQSNMVVAPASGLFLPISVITKKNNLLMEKLNQVIQTVRDMGLVTQWKKMDFNQILRKRIQWEMSAGIFHDREEAGHVQPIRIKQILGPLGMLLLGHIAAAITFLGERMSMLVMIVANVKSFFQLGLYFIARKFFKDSAAGFTK